MNWNRLKSLVFLMVLLGSKPLVAWSQDSAQPAELAENTSNSSFFTNRHVVGWTNLLIPGSGQLLLGRPWRGLAELSFSVGTFSLGTALSGPGAYSLDGVQNELPSNKVGRFRGTTESSVTAPLYAQILQQVGIKSHMTFVYLSYREAALRNGYKNRIDTSSESELFLAPFSAQQLINPWVWAPIAITGIAATVDYLISKKNDFPVVPRFTPYSNFLYTLDYQVTRPIGSSVPEEGFYRGFVQNEMYSVVDSPWFAIPASTLAFVFSHGPGYGRIGAAVAGLYLGSLAHKYNGDLKPGITVHFWSSLLLGIETVFLLHDSQATTPPTALSVQVNY